MPPLDYFKMLIDNDFYELEIVNNFALWCELHTIGALVKGMRLFGVWSRGQFQASLKRRNVLIHELGGGLGLVAAAPRLDERLPAAGIAADSSA